MVQQFPPLEDMRNDVSIFLGNYNEQIPAHTTNADIQALWLTVNRIQMFRQMASMTDSESEYNLFCAVADDYEMLASAFLHSIDMKSDEMARVRQMAVEQRAIAGKYNIDPDAMAS